LGLKVRGLDREMGKKICRVETFAGASLRQKSSQEKVKNLRDHLSMGTLCVLRESLAVDPENDCLNSWGGGVREKNYESTAKKVH